MTKIDEAIQIKKFHSEWHRATVNVAYTSSWIAAILEKRAERKQLTLQQFNVLRILRGQFPKPATNNLIRQRMISNTPDISRLMDRLVHKGLVSRSKCPEDKRAVDLVITDLGLQILDDLEEDMLMEDILPNNISAEECKILSDLLDKLRGNQEDPRV